MVEFQEGAPRNWDHNARAKVEKSMQNLGCYVGARLPKRWGFILIAAAFDSVDSVYVSNCHRENMVRLLREIADNLEASADFNVTEPPTKG